MGRVAGLRMDVLLGIVWLVLAGVGSDFRSARGGARSTCPGAQLTDCFRDAFRFMRASVSPMIMIIIILIIISRHMEAAKGDSGSGPRTSASGCDKYAKFVVCFSYANCGLGEAASAAAAAYEEAGSGLGSGAPPVEAFIAVYGHVKTTCAFGCSQVRSEKGGWAGGGWWDGRRRSGSAPRG